MHNCLYSCQSCPSSQSTICNHTEDITVQCSRLYTVYHCILSSLVSLSFTFCLVYDSGSQGSGTGGIASACDCKIYKIYSHLGQFCCLYKDRIKLPY